VTFRAVFSPHAIRAYKKLEKSARTNVDKAVEELTHDPIRGPNIKKLKGNLREYRCYRTGDYRLLYAVSPVSREVFVDYIQDRKDVYKKSG